MATSALKVSLCALGRFLKTPTVTLCGPRVTLNHGIHGETIEKKAAQAEEKRQVAMVAKCLKQPMTHRATRYALTPLVGM